MAHFKSCDKCQRKMKRVRRKPSLYQCFNPVCKVKTRIKKGGDQGKVKQPVATKEGEEA